ncbi:MAG: hypothetical protein OIN88_06425 [Candidatus Methanoperedens sp.]|nr:hypothetical protein [Candidatus Methanoperedens sp.]MCZ7359095.1 hypothetical protein [Candidatus Methanoperedens sp.]HLB70303.1 hypothetical protein [Candidatus Methanoperedens sp.]
MEKADKKELIIAAVVFAAYVIFVLAQRNCGSTPGSCGTGWIFFGAFAVGAVVFLKIKVFS